MRLIYVAALALLIGSALPQQTPQMSHEEAVVRTTYARLAFAVQVNEVHEAIREAQKRGDGDIEQADFARRLKDAEVKFILSDFKVGNVTDPDIGKLRYDELVTRPSGDILDIGTGEATFVTDEPKKTRSAIATIRWQPGQSITEDWTQTWSSMLPQVEHSKWLTRYASFKVKVAFAGRSREYHGIFVFGRTPAGAEYIVPVDTIAGLTGGLDFFTTRDAYPEALIEGKVGTDLPAVRNWLTSQAVSGRKHSDNCDPATLKCGISEDDLKQVRPWPISRKGRPHLTSATSTYEPKLPAPAQYFGQREITDARL